MRRALRLVVVSPDGRRVLARPNGLAGWALPTIATDDPGRWTDADGEAAAAVVGAPVDPLVALEPGGWAVRPGDRVPATGTTWIGEPELDRLGSDAALARAWFRHDTGDRG